jgi:transmembrane sensor
VWRVAATVVVVAFGAVLATLWSRDAGWDTVVADGARTVTFADGSTVDLADGARLAMPGDGVADARQARLLGGRALFRITRNPTDPFEVTTPNAEVTVLGTTFTVEASDVQTDVVLVSGVVSLAPRATPAAAVRLAPGQRSRVLALDAPSAPEAADLRTLDWTGTVIVRDSIRVGDLVARLAGQFDVPVAVDAALRDEWVSRAEYGANGLRDALDNVARAFSARVETDGAGFRLTAE